MQTRITRGLAPLAMNSLTAAVLLSSAASAQAQIAYTSQSRSVLAQAQAVEPQAQLIYPSYCAAPYCAPTGQRYVLAGDQKLQQVVSTPTDFGALDQTASATASSNALSGQASIQSHSELNANGLSITATGSMSHVGPTYMPTPGNTQNPYAFSEAASVYYNGSPMASVSSNALLTFTLSSRTSILIDQSFASVGNNSAQGKLTISGANQFLISETGNLTGKAYTLAAGDYTLQWNAGAGFTSYNGVQAAGTFASSLSVRAVPEASTLSLMGLGLLAVGMVARRRSLVAQA